MTRTGPREACGRRRAAAPAAAALLPLVLLLGACREVGESSIDLLAPAPVGEGVSFSADVQPILTQRCAQGGCHAPPLAVPGADFTEGNAYGSLVDVPSLESTLFSASPESILDRVEPFDPARSYLFLKITGCSVEGCFLSPMPLAPAPALGANETAILRQWIEEGAAQN